MMVNKPNIFSRPSLGCLIGLSVAFFSGCATLTTQANRAEVKDARQEMTVAVADSFMNELAHVNDVSRQVLNHIPQKPNENKLFVLPFIYADWVETLERACDAGEKEGVMLGGVLPRYRQTAKYQFGDEILEVNGQPVDSEKDIRTIMDSLQGANEVKVLFRRMFTEWIERVPVFTLNHKMPVFLDGIRQKPLILLDQRGYLYLTRTLLSFVQNDDELAFLLAKEFARAYQKEAKTVSWDGNFSPTEKSMTTDSLKFFLEGRRNAAENALGDFGPYASKPYILSTNHLKEKIGFEYVKNAGYDPLKGFEFMERYAAEMPKRYSKNIFVKIMPVPDAKDLALLRRYAEEAAGSQVAIT